MPIPEREKLKLAILRLLGDDGEHSSARIREHLRAHFNIAPHEDSYKLENGKTPFENEVDLALANLQGAPSSGPKLIEKVKKKVYRISGSGKVYLKQNS